MTSKSRWIFLIPIVSFAVGAGLFIQNESAVRVKFERAQKLWRIGANEDAVDLYLELKKQHPRSKYAVRALWETATVYYYNLYDLSNAIYYFEELVADYPQSEYALRSRLKLAEIYELELNDTAKVLEQLIAIRMSPFEYEDDEGIQFRIAEAYFKMENYETALEQFKPIILGSEDLHLIQKALLRTGTILQIQKRHGDSIEYFERVLNETECEDCRLQAQLGLIESYELEDQIGKAIEIAEQIDGKKAQAEKIQELLLQRLLEKQKYYEPKLWSRR